ncbi:tyrosine-type recombinase/integrase [Waterburya agarophytonicola K14]|uniref:Tyrosine-type recombinase/integrase n=1 Tax=Waterburya agarophytonicola KI4 TaxID=2874699 RepID=A0A964BM23_9CYAN|nr:tyrosine-type recombinase/integrase [Waterburya agarophytonicola]MCC0175894.1 tyrosine-type recombinase/integrase [Waterburya agarophytonicola KI4]
MSELTSVVTRLEASLVTPIGSSFPIESEPDVVAQLLALKRSPNTRRAYSKDIKDFFQVIVESEPTRDLVLEFLHLEQTQAVQLVLNYKAKLINKELKAATINRRLAALKSLTKIGRNIGVCNYTLENIPREKNQPYRDTTGVDKDAINRVFVLAEQVKKAKTHRSRLKGIRDYALLRLLWGNALRRGEISSSNISDFNFGAKTLLIIGKGSGGEKQKITLPPKSAIAISEWLLARGEDAIDAPLFTAVDNANYGKRLSGNAIYTMVDKLCVAAGIPKKMSPHRIRHSAITAALDATDGNIRKVQKLSRHKDINTVMTYDDNRSNDQDEMSQLLDDLI